MQGKTPERNAKEFSCCFIIVKKVTDDATLRMPKASILPQTIAADEDFT